MIETENLYRDIAKDLETKVDTRGYSKDDTRPQPTGENKKVIGKMDDEPGGIIIEFVELRENMFAYRKIDKKLKDTHYEG